MGKNVEKYISLLGEHFCLGNNINSSTKCEIRDIEAKKLIVSSRLDLVAKYKYVEFKEKKIESSFAKDLYAKHIEAFTKGTFTEPGNKEKNSIDKYINTFDLLIENIKKDGFDFNNSIIPMGENLSILDGAHRTSVAAFYEKDVRAIKFDDLKLNFDYDFFKKRLLEDKYLDYLINEYCKLKKNIYIACMWPIAKNKKKREEAEKLINKYGELICKKEVAFNYNGLKNFMLQIYGHHNWIGNHMNNYKGVESKVDSCYYDGHPVSVYVFECESLSKVIELKENVRDLFNISNHSIHITDNFKESIQMANLIFNNNCIEFMNKRKPNQFNQFNNFFEELKKEIKDNNINEDEIIIIDDSVMELYGIKEAGKIGVICKNNYSFKSKYIYDARNIIEGIGYTEDELIYNPENYIFFQDVKFISLNTLAKIKKMNREIEDLELINNFNIKNRDKLIQRIRNSINIKVKYIKRRFIQIVFKTLKYIGLTSYLKKVYLKLK